MAFPLLGPILGALLGWLLSLLKTLIVQILLAVFVYVIYRIFMIFGATVIDWALKQISSGVNLSDATLQFTGMGAWLAEQLMLGQCISLLISFCVVRFIIKMVRG